jgi:hypothetical protein
MDVGTSFAVLPSFKRVTYRVGLGGIRFQEFELKREVFKELHLKESSRYNKMGLESVEANTLGHRSREVGSKISSLKEMIKWAFRLI